MRRKISLTLAGTSLVFAQACDNLTTDQRTVAGVSGGATAGLITAEILDADDNWRLIAALAGAATGVIVAQNETTQQCAYARNDGTYSVAACP